MRIEDDIIDHIRYLPAIGPFKNFLPSCPLIHRAKKKRPPHAAFEVIKENPVSSSNHVLLDQIIHLKGFY